MAVVGVGAFGRNHARVYRELQQQGKGVELVAIVDQDAARAAAVAAEVGAQPFSSLDALKGRVDAASVAVPTVAHLPVARALMEAGIDVLIEKPLAPSLPEADELIRLARTHGRVAQVGHLERFNPAVRATVPLVTQPMFFEVHRLSVFTPRSLDIDVVLDLMIHDLDVVLSFVRSPVKEVRAVGLPILTGKVDIANVRMEFDSGCVANFTASRVSTERVRKLRFFQPHQYVSIDYTRQDVMIFAVEQGGPPQGPLADMLAASEDTHPSSADIKLARPEVAHEEPLHAELSAFLEAVRARSQPLVPLDDGRRALALALEILAAIREHSRRVNLDALRAAPRP
ncbi:MAG TPA: Gfo/Idh/MocA family oxidoreductase [Terriglobales bacterium]|nr:Gfo/Idh/MocA family oxidoreductase [Terriglobales bacterium]